MPDDLPSQAGAGVSLGAAQAYRDAQKRFSATDHSASAADAVQPLFQNLRIGSCGIFIAPSYRNHTKPAFQNFKPRAHFQSNDSYINENEVKSMFSDNRKSLRKAAMALGTMAVLGGAVASANTAAASHNPCHPAAVSAATIAGLPCGAANPCAATNPCGASNPCAAANPCAAVNPCSATKTYAAPNHCSARLSR